MRYCLMSTGAGQLGRAQQQPRQTKVQQFRDCVTIRLIRKDHIAGFNIAVNHAVRVRVT